MMREKIGIAIGGLSLAIALVGVAAPPTEAGRGRYSQPRVTGEYYFEAGHGRFYVPQRIRHAPRYARYLLGNYRYRSFGLCRVYEFPVQTRRGVRWVPHVYHRGRLVAHGDWVYDRIVRRDSVRRDRFRRDKFRGDHVRRDRSGRYDHRPRHRRGRY